MSTKFPLFVVVLKAVALIYFYLYKILLKQKNYEISWSNWQESWVMQTAKSFLNKLKFVLIEVIPVISLIYLIMVVTILLGTLWVMMATVALWMNSTILWIKKQWHQKNLARLKLFGITKKN